MEGQAAQGLELPSLVKGVPACGRGWNEMDFQVPSNPNQLGILEFYIAAG